MTYLDSAATTKPLNSIVKAIQPYLETYWHNPSSVYSSGVKVKQDIETVRKDVAKLINVNTEEIYFTSGSCEGNNWVIRGFDDANLYKDSVIITTPIEHKSIIDAVNNPALRSDVHFCKVDNDGLINIEALKKLLDSVKDKKILVSVIWANNEIGTIQPLKKIAELVHSYDGILHTDATQIIGHLPVDVQKIGVDILSASAQKLGGLKGTGFLYKKNGIDIRPLIYGEQENQNRAGTENVIGIIALGEAVRHCAVAQLKAQYNNISRLRDYFISKLEDKFGCKVNGDRVQRLPNNINVTFLQDITGESLLYMLDTSEIMVGLGSACNSRSIEVSHVLKAIGLTDEEASKTIRISLSDSISEVDIDEAIKEIDKAIKIITLK